VCKCPKGSPPPLWVLGNDKPDETMAIDQYISFKNSVVKFSTFGAFSLPSCLTIDFDLLLLASVTGVIRKCKERVEMKIERGDGTGKGKGWWGWGWGWGCENSPLLPSGGYFFIWADGLYRYMPLDRVWFLGFFVWNRILFFQGSGQR